MSLQQDRRAGGGDGGVVEAEVGRGVLHDVGGRALVLDRLVAREPHDHLRVRAALVVSGKKGRSDLRMLPSLSWSRKSTYSGLSSWRSSTGMAEMRSSVWIDDAVRTSLPSARGVALGGVEEQLACHATRRVARLGVDEVVGELERCQRGDHREHLAAVADLVGDLLPLLVLLGAEQLGDLGALVHR